jgi:hypothetical protein
MPQKTSRLQVETSSVENRISTVEVSTCRRVILQPLGGGKLSESRIARMTRKVTDGHEAGDLFPFPDQVVKFCF